MRETKVKTLCTMLGIMLLAGTSFGGALATDGNVSTFGGTTWQGTASFNSVADDLYVTVDYCVYDPGNFTYGTYDDFATSSTIAPAANEYVYAYQVTSTGTAVANVFSVNMLNSNEAVNIGSVASSDRTPDFIDFDAAAPNRLKAWWNFFWFSGAGMNNGESSDVLVYSSVNAPIWGVGTIQNTGATPQNIVPTPSDVIPEPTTLVLLAVGGLAAIRRRRR